jgi:hypothetical protein
MNFMKVDFPDPGFPDTQKVPLPVRNQSDSRESKAHWKVF